MLERAGWAFGKNLKRLEPVNKLFGTRSAENTWVRSDLFGTTRLACQSPSGLYVATWSLYSLFISFSCIKISFFPLPWCPQAGLLNTGRIYFLKRPVQTSQHMCQLSECSNTSCLYTGLWSTRTHNELYSCSRLEAALKRVSKQAAQYEYQMKDLEVRVGRTPAFWWGGRSSGELIGSALWKLE